MCRSCVDTLPANQPACPGCAEPMPVDRHLCGRCQVDPPLHERIVVPWRYEGVMTHLVRRLKFDSRISHARLLGELLGSHVCQYLSGDLPQALIAVPLHPERQRRRGYNQAQEIARHVARITGIPLFTGAVARVRATSSQATLNRAARRHNLRDAFSVRTRLPRHVAIVDDVVTTGSTVRELCQMLLDKGVQRIEVWAVARAVRSSPIR